jgi:hypothetical protein
LRQNRTSSSQPIRVRLLVAAREQRSKYRISVAGSLPTDWSMYTGST